MLLLDSGIGKGIETKKIIDFSNRDQIVYIEIGTKESIIFFPSLQLGDYSEFEEPTRSYVKQERRSLNYERRSLIYEGRSLQEAGRGRSSVTMRAARSEGIGG
uniref:Uncharacterized protein n=1 Tax=Cacopsylla melanoneura TaxID=428564 RepID=A0A8D8TIP0_9HEMI